MEVLSSAQMMEADRYTIEEIGIPSIVLMENAAKGIFEEFLKCEVKKDKIAVVVGKGNNGGDGLAVARHLINNGFSVDVILIYPPEDFKGDAKINYDILKKYPVKFIQYDENVEFDSYDVIFDAIFGTGLGKAVKGVAEQVIEKINFSRGFKIAVDIPSGLSGSSYEIFGKCVKADLTVTLARPKIVHVFYPAKKMCGEVVVKDISIPDSAVSKVNPELFMLNYENLPLIYKREPDSHKGNFGHNVVIGGSKGKMGAPVMAAYASLMAGAGLTTCAIFEDYYYYLSRYPEVMAYIVQGKDFYTLNEVNAIVDFVQDKDVLTIGCGMGRNHQIKEFLAELIDKTDHFTVIDADGLFHLDEILLEKLRYRAVLTPHIGEFARLLGVSKDEVLKDRINLAKEFAIKYGVVLVLKSADTIIATPDGLLFVVSNGVPALAKGGSGDCLAGVIGGLIAQKYSLVDAAKIGCFVMNVTASLLMEEKNEKCIKTTEVIENLYRGFNKIEAYQ
ncbi:NAD(P)H-hydrate dehydratase [Deferribacter autotrophicus]|uniref:Bifunctional NAD(P)H-hydrate repair enzyme n=1 Tax=Deferribacter autotrophicus TaxID=500465 RepID=A0A5A8EYT5_9BACT|nr:NAD(P)H-hydrate dehydratase [Deferribacter autotrophicus]KAA0256821.1 NAD(P)H-hydrate dehydratase [Deferribacter autotrophicus]